MNVHEITPAIDTDPLLAGAQFADAFRIEASMDPRSSMRGMRR